VPELPELMTIAQKLSERLKGESIQVTKVYDHLVIHGSPVDDFLAGFDGEVIQDFTADGKFLIGNLVHSDLVVNPMLTGRFRLVAKRRKKQLKSDMFSIKTENFTLWYSDLKRMGRVYLVPKNDYSSVAGFEGRGPSPLNPELTLPVFKERIRRHRGQIKNVLRNQKFLKGIGNAYADEILLYAGILPFRRRSTLTDSEIGSLFTATQKVLSRILEILSERGINEIALEKRDFMMVHRKGGGICPLCGGRISEVTANRFKTNYCQTCQR
jgi:formamidopyrimidine-DNA glycosylase